VKKNDALNLRDTLVNLTPRYPNYISLRKMCLALATQRNIHMKPERVAVHLKKAVQNEHISFMGGRCYTRAITPQEKFDARQGVKPVVKKLPRHNPTPGLLSELKALNASYRAELEGA
jgi:hypothetical protein